jgi:hypothetical protein
MRHKIRILLKESPLTLEQLIIKMEEKEPVIAETVRTMLDGSELQYDKAGRLALKL